MEKKIHFLEHFKTIVYYPLPHFLFIPPNEDLTQNTMELFDVKISHNKHIINHSDNKQEGNPGMKKSNKL